MATIMYMGLPISEDSEGRIGFVDTNPLEILAGKQNVFSREFADFLDSVDPLKDFKSKFLFPKRNHKDVVYFVGNSLGLQPVGCLKYIQSELESWSSRGVNGHFEGDTPWLIYDELLVDEMARIVGAIPSEIAVMNSLTVNLHLLLIRFFNRATTCNFNRRKILIESRSFPSDYYAIVSELKMRGLDPNECIVELLPRENESLLTTSDITQRISEIGDELALVVFSGVQFYSGQLFDIPTITRAAHQVGAFALWDLAHAVGNVDLQLHEWGVDGACWCSYKYLNSGPGGIGGFYIHEKHFNDEKSDRLLGWWSHDVSTRFEMTNRYEPSIGANEFRLSNVPILSSAALLSSLELFKQSSMKDIRCKSILLTKYLEELLLDIRKKIPTESSFDIITGSMRGAQLSLLFKSNSRARKICCELEKNGIMVDYRKPGLVRASPAPLYCSFSDVVEFRDQLVRVIYELEK
jgi:kynureninase